MEFDEARISHDTMSLLSHHATDQDREKYQCFRDVSKLSDREISIVNVEPSESIAVIMKCVTSDALEDACSMMETGLLQKYMSNILCGRRKRKFDITVTIDPLEISQMLDYPWAG